jgi:hypothetical protein
METIQTGTRKQCTVRLCPRITPPSNAPCSLIEVPVFVPGVGPPMFLMIYRNSTYEEDIQAARYFISKHPVFGLDSRPSKDEDIKRKMLYVLTMIELVRPLYNLQPRSHAYQFFAAQVFVAFFSRLLCLGQRDFQPSTFLFSPEKNPFEVTFPQFEPLMLQSKTGRKVFLDLGSRRGEYFSHFHKFYFFKDFEWMLFECNKYAAAAASVMVFDLL